MPKNDYLDGQTVKRMGKLGATTEEGMFLLFEKGKELRYSDLEDLCEKHSKYVLKPGDRVPTTIYMYRRGEDEPIFHTEVSDDKCEYIAFYNPKRNEEFIKKFIKKLAGD